MERILNTVNKFILLTPALLLAAALLLTACAERVEIKREWPVPVNTSKEVIKQCNLIHKRTCPIDRGELINATYYFDLRKLPAVEIEVNKMKIDKNNTEAYERALLLKKIEAASAYSATFTKSDCTIEYYVQGKNVTCEKFLDYMDKLKKECPDCIETIIVDPKETAYSGETCHPFRY